MIHTILLVLACTTTIVAIGMAGELFIGGRSLRRLATLELPRPGSLPPISIVIAARNEERNLEEALRSVLALQGDDVEIIVVNDRSTDGTGPILDRIAEAEPRLRIVHLTELPAGWLGKNHALWRGAQQARGALLLFTDADVVMERTALARAAAHLVDGNLDHITIGPDVHMPGVMVQAVGVAFTVFFALFARPWKAPNPRSRYHVGVGAFNLIRAGAYHAIGTHQAIAMRPDDDMKLGKLVKLHHLRQEFLIGTEMIRVEWYASLAELVNGLKKNSFAGLGYSLALVIAATIAHVLLFVWPVAALAFTTGWALAANVATTVILLAIFIGAAAGQRLRWWHGALFPVSSVIFLYIIWNSTVSALAAGGIDWRGTRYSLAELRKNRV